MKLNAKITKADDEQRLVFGWASVAQNADGTSIVDAQGDVIDVAELEKAAYNFVVEYREGGEMHERTGVAELVESMVFTPDKVRTLKLDGKIPFGWWIGFHVTDETVWQKIKSGEYSALSIGGTATREDISDDKA